VQVEELHELRHSRPRQPEPPGQLRSVSDLAGVQEALELLGRSYVGHDLRHAEVRVFHALPGLREEYDDLRDPVLAFGGVGEPIKGSQKATRSIQRDEVRRSSL